MRLLFLTANVCAVFFLLISSAFAQPRLEFKTLRTVGPTPSIIAPVSVPENEIAGLRLDPIGQRIHWILGNDWYRLHIPTRTWSRHTIQNGFDVYEPRWDVVPGTSKLRVWDGGVGRVYRVDSSGVSTRIDRSFDQKNQYGHSHHVEADGTIHAIGGWGLYIPKNFGVQFSEVSRGWHRTSGRETVVTDPYVAGGFSLKDPMSDELLLFSGYGEMKSPDALGLLTMNMTSGTIQLRHRDLPLVHHTDIHGLAMPLVSSVHNGTHRLAFAYGSQDQTSNLTSSLIALDLDTYHRVNVKGTIGTDLVPRHLLFHYSETDSTLYGMHWTHATIEYHTFLSLTAAKVDVDALKAVLRNGEPPISSSEASITDQMDLPIVIATAVLMLIGGIVVWKRRSKTAPLPAPRQPDGVPLSVTLSPLFLNEHSWNDRVGGEFPLEARLLELLAEAMLAGQPIVSSDTIDRLLIPDHPSPDYIRKTRNQTRKRLEETLQSMFPTHDGQAYIVINREILDKRKTKLQLNPKLVTVSRPE